MHTQIHTHMYAKLLKINASINDTVATMYKNESNRHFLPFLEVSETM